VLDMDQFPSNMPPKMVILDGDVLPSRGHNLGALANSITPTFSSKILQCTVGVVAGTCMPKDKSSSSSRMP
jgi:hypothetical protein